MSNLFLLLFLGSIACLIIGLVEPTTFSRQIKGDLTRRKIWKIFGVAAVIFLILFGVTTDSKETEKATKTKRIVKDEKKLKYQIIHEWSDHRYDGGKEYNVLINPVDLTSSKFKEDIKAIAQKIVAEKGKRISIVFHDSRESLNSYYKGYTELRPWTKEENKIMEKHYIAAYSGELEASTYLNSLMFFPSAFKGSPEVGKFVETIEYDASK